MPGYKLSAQAEEDFADIYLFTLTTFGYRQAEDYTGDMQDVFLTLANNPRMGRDAGELRTGLRRHEHGSHAIFYREDPEGVFIFAILHHEMSPEIHI
jgi:toxin ParE1/3/4